MKGMGIQVIQIRSESCKLTRACKMERNYSSGKLQKSPKPNRTGQKQERGKKGKTLHPKTLRVAGGPWDGPSSG